MAKSKCALCGTQLKGGEWMLKVIEGEVRKVCANARNCNTKRISKLTNKGW